MFHSTVPESATGLYCSGHWQLFLVPWLREVQVQCFNWAKFSINSSNGIGIQESFQDLYGRIRYRPDIGSGTVSERVWAQNPFKDHTPLILMRGRVNDSFQNWTVFKASASEPVWVQELHQELNMFRIRPRTGKASGSDLLTKCVQYQF